MLRRATNLTVAESFQPCMVGEAVTAKSYRQLLFLCYKQKADIEGGSKLYSLASALAFGGFSRSPFTAKKEPPKFPPGGS